MKHTKLHLPRVLSILFLFSALALTTSVSIAGRSAQFNLLADSPVAPIVQFTSHGHALGFQSNGVVVSNASYALRVDIVGRIIDSRDPQFGLKLLVELKNRSE